MVIVQVKSSLSDTGFKPSDIEKFRSFTEDFLDLSTPAANYRHKYHSHLLTIIQTFKDKYLEIAGNFPEVEVDYYLVTRGDENEIDQAACDTVIRLQEAVHRHLLKLRAHFLRSTHKPSWNMCESESRQQGQSNGQRSHWRQMMDMSAWCRFPNM